MTNANVIMGGDVFVAPKGTNPLRPAGWSKLGHLVSVERTMDTEEYGWLQSTRTNLEVAGDMTIVTDPSKDEGEKPPEPPEPKLATLEPLTCHFSDEQVRMHGSPPNAFDALDMMAKIPSRPPSTHWIVDGFNLVDAVKDRTRGPWERLGWTTHRDLPEWPEAFDAPKKLDCTPKTYEFTFTTGLDEISPEVLRLYYGADYAKYAGEARKKEEQLSNDNIAEFESTYGTPYSVKKGQTTGRAVLRVCEAPALLKHDDVPLLAHELFAKSAHEKPERMDDDDPEIQYAVDHSGLSIVVYSDATARNALNEAIANLAAYAEWVRGAEAREEAQKKAAEEVEKKAKAEEALKAAQDLAKSKGLKVGDKVKGYGDFEGVLESIGGDTPDKAGGDCKVRWTKGWALKGLTLGATLERLTKIVDAERIDGTPKVGDRVRHVGNGDKGLLVEDLSYGKVRIFWDSDAKLDANTLGRTHLENLRKIEESKSANAPINLTIHHASDPQATADTIMSAIRHTKRGGSYYDL